MSLITEIPEIGVNERMRFPYAFLSAQSVTSTWTSNHFLVGNITGCVIWIKGTSAAGTPNMTLSLETSPDQTDGNFKDVSAIARPDFAAIADEVAHVYTVNFSNVHNYARFKLTLNVGDGGDDVVTMKVIFLYGSMTQVQDITLETGDLEIGAVEIKDAAADNRADVNDANTARTTGTHVVAVQHIDAAGKVLSSYTEDAASGGAVPNTVVGGGLYRAVAPNYTDGDYACNQYTQDGKLKVAATLSASEYADDGNGFTLGSSNGQATFFVADETDPDSVDEGDVGIARMTLERKLHVANTEAHDAVASAYAGMVGFESKTFDGAALPNPVNAEADIVRGAASLSGVQYVMCVNQDGSVERLPTLGTGVMAGSAPVTVATDDTQFGAVGAAADVDGNIHGQLRSIGEALEKIDDWEDAGAFADYAKATIYGDNGAGAPIKMLMDAAGNPQVDVVTLPVGTQAMAASTPVTIATDDTQFGAVGAAADVDGNIHGQLRYIGEAVDGLETPIIAMNTGGSLFFDSDGDNTAQALKAGAGTLYKLHVYNPNGVAAFVQLFDVAAGGVTVGTTAPNFVVFVPAQGAVTEEFGATGANFATAITYACTTTPTGSGDPTTGLTVSALYK